MLSLLKVGKSEARLKVFSEAQFLKAFSRGWAVYPQAERKL